MVILLGAVVRIHFEVSIRHPAGVMVMVKG